MPKNDIGGLFLSLGLIPDKVSFETGNKLIDGTIGKFNHLMGAARNASAVLLATTIATGAVESSNYKLATSLGMTTETLDLWKASAKIAGVSADGLVGSMGKLAYVLNHMKVRGEGLKEYQTQLAKLKMGINELKDPITGKWLDNATAYQKIIERAQKQYKEAKTEEERQTVRTVVGDILGPEGQKFFIELERQNKSIAEFLAEAQKTIYTTAGDNQAGADFAVEVNKIRTATESMSKLLGDKTAEKLLPYVKGINEWIDKNGDTIKTAIDNISTAVENILGKMKPYVTDAAEATVALLAGDKEKADTALTDLGFQVAADTAGKLTGQSKEDIIERYKSKTDVINAASKELANKKGYDTYSEMLEAHKIKGQTWKIDFDELSPELQTAINNIRKEDSKFMPAVVNTKKQNNIKDGIMRPDGTVTQVAPDDWVFAARDLGDMAKAFIPNSESVRLAQNPELDRLAALTSSLVHSFVPHSAPQNAGPSEYVINQTFNIGGTSDLPQVIKQQAYRGTQEGMLQMMQQSSRRMQLMSGQR